MAEARCAPFLKEILASRARSIAFLLGAHRSSWFEWRSDDGLLLHWKRVGGVGCPVSRLVELDNGRKTSIPFGILPVSCLFKEN